MSGKLNWLVFFLMLLACFCWFNNRAFYHDQVDISESIAIAYGGSQAALAEVHKTGKQLNDQLHLIQAAFVGLSLLLIVRLRKQQKSVAG